MHSTSKTSLAPRRWRRIITYLSVGFLFATVSPAVNYQVEVEQGGVAQWEGDDLTRCAMDGKSFLPVDGSCWYPIDFKRKPGKVEIARWASEGYETGWLEIVAREFVTQDIEFPDDKYIHLSQEDLDRHFREQAKIKPILRKDWKKPGLFTLPFGPPAENLPQGEGFGAHRTFNGEPRAQHRGTDYAISAGVPVAAIAPGDVVIAEEHFFSGLGVYIHHGNGLLRAYFHLQSAIENGSSVGQGEKIGEVGSTGRSTGPHMHLGMVWRGAWIDPEWLTLKSDSIPQVQEAP